MMGGAWVLRDSRCGYTDYSDVDIFGKINIGSNVHIGTNTIIMPNVEIGDNCIIGCGAIVTHDIPSNSVAVGVPARVIEDLDTYVEKNKKRFLHTKKLSPKDKRIYIKNTYK